MKALVLAGALALALALPVAAQTPEPAPACSDTLPAVVDMLTAAGVAFKVIEGEEMAKFLADFGIDPTGVVRVLLAVLDGVPVFGLETADGCLSPPTRIVAPAPAANTLSGVTEFGIFA